MTLIGDISNIGEWPEISDENIEACNGIIHGISNVILPASKILQSNKNKNTKL